MTRLKLWAAIVLLVSLAGCLQTERPEEYTVRLTQILGYVTVKGTELSISASVTIGGKTIEVENGRFHYSLPPDTYTYHAATLLGEVTGTFTYDGRHDTVVRIEIPMEHEWDPELFNDLFVFDNSFDGREGYTLRWEHPRVVSVWSDSDLEIEDALREMYGVWEEALRGVVTFEFVDWPDDAEIVYRGSESGEGYASILEGGHLAKYEFSISKTTGIGKDVLWRLSAQSVGFAQPPAGPPTPQHKELLRLMYALPSGTPAQQ